MRGRVTPGTPARGAGGTVLRGLHGRGIAHLLLGGGRRRTHHGDGRGVVVVVDETACVGDKRGGVSLINCKRGLIFKYKVLRELCHQPVIFLSL